MYGWTNGRCRTNAQGRNDYELSAVGPQSLSVAWFGTYLVRLAPEAHIPPHTCTPSSGPMARAGQGSYEDGCLVTCGVSFVPSSSCQPPQLTPPAPCPPLIQLAAPLVSCTYRAIHRGTRARCVDRRFSGGCLQEEPLEWTCRCNDEDSLLFLGFGEVSTGVLR